MFKKKEKISISSGAVIYRDLKGEPREYLLVKGWNLKWGFAKGNIEKGELPHHAAKREVKEETGLDVELTDGFRESYKYDLKLKSFLLQKVIRKEVIIFLSEVRGNPVIVKQDSEIVDFGWFNFKTAYDKLSFKERKDILKKAEQFIKKTVK